MYRGNKTDLTLGKSVYSHLLVSNVTKVLLVILYIIQIIKQNKTKQNKTSSVNINISNIIWLFKLLILMDVHFL